MLVVSLFDLHLINDDSAIGYLSLFYLSLGISRINMARSISFLVRLKIFSC